METRASYIIVGIFTLLVLLGGVVAVIWIAGVELDEDVAQYDIYFKGSVTGLKPGNQVRYRGVPFGVVTTMRIDPENVERIKVTVEVPRKPRIKSDAVAALEYQGITGIAYVQISGGTQKAPALARKTGQKRPVIPSKASQLEQLFETAPELINRFIALVDRANRLLNPKNQASLAKTLVNIESFTGALSDSSGDIRTMLRNGAASLDEVRSAAAEARQALQKLRGSSDRMTNDAEAAVKQARALVFDLRKKVNILTGQASQTMTNVGDSVNRVSRSVETSVDKVSKGLNKTLGGIGRDFTGLSGDARRTLSEVHGLTSELRQNALLFTEGVGKAMKSVQKEMDGVGRDARAAITTANKAAGHVGDAAEQLAGFLAENRQPVEDFTASGLYELTQLLSETRVLVNALTRISTQLEQDPARFLFGQSQPGVEVK